MGPPSYYIVFCQELPCGEEGVVSQRRQAHTEGKNVPKTKKEHLKPLSDGSADTITDTHTHIHPKAQAHNYLGAATKYEQESHTVTLTVIHTGRRLTHSHHTPGTRSHHHTTTHTHYPPAFPLQPPVGSQSGKEPHSSNDGAKH